MSIRKDNAMNALPSYCSTSGLDVKPRFDVTLSHQVDWCTVQLEDAVPDTGAPDRAELIEVLRAWREALLARAMEVRR